MLKKNNAGSRHVLLFAAENLAEKLAFGRDTSVREHEVRKPGVFIDGNDDFASRKFIVERRINYRPVDHVNTQYPVCRVSHRFLRRSGQSADACRFVASRVGGLPHHLDARVFPKAEEERKKDWQHQRIFNGGRAFSVARWATSVPDKNVFLLLIDHL